jgi:hypothetical protein
MFNSYSVNPPLRCFEIATRSAGDDNEIECKNDGRRGICRTFDACVQPPRECG